MSTNAKTNTSARDAAAAEITQQILAGLNKSAGVSFTTRVFQYASDKISDSGDGIAELASGFKAAANNFEIAKNAADVRQAQRTAAKVERLVQLELKARGI